jgi:ACS family hexuronate transporter-like MFS transporter
MRRRWFVTGLIFSGGLLSYMDRAVFGVLAPMIQEDLQLSSSQLGVAHAIFSLGYTPLAFVGGYLADRFGSKIVLSVSMAMWSVFCGLTGAINSFLALLGVRVAFGAAEGPWSPCANKLLYNWFPKSGYAAAFGITNAGQPLGGMVAGPIVGLFAAMFGWRGAFVAVALFGLLWLVGWLAFAQDHPSEPIDDDEKLPDTQDVSGGAISADADMMTIRAVLLQPTLIANNICFFGFGYSLSFFISWFPTYLTQTHDMSLADMSLASAVPWAAGVLGLSLGGLFTEFMTRLLRRTMLVRKAIIWIGLSIAAAGLLVGAEAQTATVAVAAMAVAVFFIYLTGPTFWTIAMAITPARHVGSVGGLMIVIAQIGAMAAPLVTGFLVEATGTFDTAFVVAAAVAVTGATALALLGRGDEPTVHR